MNQQQPNHIASQPAPGQTTPAQMSPAPRRGGKPLVAGVAGLASLALVGGGLAYLDPFDWREADLADTPASALPADATGYLALDFDPSAGQKLELVRFAMKFPALKEKVGLSEDSDLKKQVIEAILKDSSCKTASYDADIAPWVGDQMAMATRPGVDDPIVAIETKDEQKAKDGLKKLGACEGGNAEMGLAYADGYLLATAKQADADKAVADAKANPLSKRAEFGEDFAKVGKLGVVNFWGEKALLDVANKQHGNVGQVSLDDVKVRSGAGTLRFTDGNPELHFVAKSTEPLTTANSHTAVGDLPADSTVALGLSGGAAGLDQTWPMLKKQLEENGDLASMEAELNLKLPDDLKTLLGDDFRVALGAFDGKVLAQQGPSALPVGIALTTDKAKLEELLSRTGLGEQLTQQQAGVVYGDKVHGIALSEAVAQKMSASGGEKLSSVPAYGKAVANADKAQGIVYVNVEKLLASLGTEVPAEQRENIDPIQAVGMSSSADGDYGISTVRMATK